MRDEPMQDGVLLTGATGFVGMELLARFLERTDRRVYALVRGADDREAAARMERTLLCLFGPDHPYAERVVAVRGRHHAPRPGPAGQARRARRAGQRDRARRGVGVLSSSASRMRSRSTWRALCAMLEFAERCQARGGLRRFSYISTAYVAGEHAGCFSEDDLDVGQRFRNAYEQSKFEAECLLAALARATARHGAAPEHHRRRARQRLDGVVQRALLAAARVRARRLRGAARAPRRAGRRGAGRLRGRRDLRAQPGPGGRGRHLPPHRRRAGEQRRRARRARDRVLQAPGAPSDRSRAVSAGGAPAARPRDARRALPPRARRAARSSSPTSPCRSHTTIVARAWRFAAPESGPRRCAPTSTGWSSSRSPPSGGGARYRAPRASRGGATPLPQPAARRRPQAATATGAGEMSSPRLSALDASFLAVETPNAHMHVGWVAVFSAPAEGRLPSFSELRDHIELRLARAPRYRQKLASVPLGLHAPEWTDDPAFSVDRHVYRAPGPLADLVEEVMSMPLRRDRPLWEMWICEDAEQRAVRDRRQDPPLHGRRPRRGRARLAAARPHARARRRASPTAGARRPSPAASGCWCGACATSSASSSTCCAGRCARRARRRPRRGRPPRARCG